MGKTFKEDRGKYERFDRYPSNKRRNNKKNKQFKPNKLSPEPSLDEPGYKDNLVDLS